MPTPLHPMPKLKLSLHYEDIDLGARIILK
jgi:hypothetical protein